jgi:signal transduction histidine kinase
VQHFEEWKADSIVPIRDIHFNGLFCHIIDSHQNLWLSYDAVGLVKYNLLTKQVKLYATEDGLPSNLFDNIVADANDNIWFPTPKGLCCLLAATDNFLNFTQRDGLPFTDFTNSYLFFDKADSSLYFSNTGYLYKINCYELLARKKQSLAKLFIDAMYVNDHPYYFTNNENISLKPDENNLQFTFTLLDLDNKISQKNYEYLLIRNNKKSGWQNLQASNIIAFDRLKAGNYTLMVRMPDESGSGYINGSNVFKFTIATVWYNTAWFILLCLATGAFVTLAFIRLYYQRKIIKQLAVIEKQKALEAERTRIAADMHDDVGAGLSRIRYIISAVKDGKNISLEDMDKIMSLSDESVEKMNEIIWSLNHGNRNLDELIYHVRSQCAAMVSNANIQFVCELPAAIPQVNLGWNESRNIYMLAKEAVNNAIKHAAATMISLDFSFKNYLEITVTDNGKGYDAATANKDGNGLKNYEKRMAALGGTFSIKSSKGAGTKVIFYYNSTPRQHT